MHEYHSCGSTMILHSDGDFTSVLVLFSGCNILAVHFTCLPNGKPSGGAYVDFASADHHKMALQHPALLENIKS